MRTTLVIDDDLYRRVKAKAAIEGRRVTDLVEEGLAAVLGRGGRAAGEPAGRRVRLPIIPARAGDADLFAGMTQQEIHERIYALQSKAERERVEPP